MSAVLSTNQKLHPMLSGLRHAELRGLWLSHLIGFSYFVILVFERAITGGVQFTRWVDLPIRLVAIWLILDRIGRRGQLKITPWDYLHLAFMSVFGIVLIYADLFMIRGSGLLNYAEWIVITFQPYLFYIITREGSLRRGFQPYILVQWILGTIAFASVVGLIQATNLAGLRPVIDDFVNQRRAELFMEGVSQSWQARGLLPHANSLAILLILGFAVLFGASRYRPPRTFEFACGAIFLVTLFATFSRTGIVSFVCLMLAVIGVIALQRKLRLASTMLFGLFVCAFLFVSLVFAFDIERYTVFVRGPGVIRNEDSRGLYGWYARMGTNEKGWNLALKHPVTGVYAASSTAINDNRRLIKNAYSFEGLLLNSYILAFVWYGVIGLAYVGGMLVLMLRFLKYSRTKQAFAVATVLCGVSLLVTGMSENTIFSPQHMIVVNIVAALAFQKVMAAEPQPGEAQREGWFERLFGISRVIRIAPNQKPS